MHNIPITAHMVVKNEDRFIWYAISSVLPYVDKFIIFDSGSSDNTIKIITSIKSKKIIFKSRTAIRAQDISNIRQEQIERTDTDWFWIVDGDEIYPFSLCKEIVHTVNLNGEKLDGIIVGRYDLLGDIYHYQDESVGSYNICGKIGHYVLRLLNKKNISRLHVEGKYPNEGYYDGSGNHVINHNPSKFIFTKGRLFHAMYLTRSSQGANLSDTYNRTKAKIELGKSISPRVDLPEVFEYEHTYGLNNAILHRSLWYEIAAYLITPIKNAKRYIWRLILQ